MPRIDPAIEAEVIRRANGRCEYCKFPIGAAELPFHIDHIISRKHEGKSTLSNLGWACFSCNLRKGPNIGGLDPKTGKLTRLFHPRNDNWSEHFYWEGLMLRGRTDVGRTTVKVLAINDPDAVYLREALIEEGLD